MGKMFNPVLRIRKNILRVQIRVSAIPNEGIDPELGGQLIT
jgi:hypothetical protein